MLLLLLLSLLTCLRMTLTSAGAVVVVVVEFPHMPEDDPHERWSCVWKVDGLITVGAWV